MMKNQPRLLTKKHIKGLQDFTDTVFKKIDQYNLDDIFDVRKQITGPLGEALVLIKLYEIMGDDYEFIWHGARKKDHDLVLRQGDSDIKIQIKTSSGVQWTFSIGVKGFENANNLRKELENGSFASTNAIIEADILKKDVDYWVFLYLPDRRFFVLDNESLIESIQCDYQRYVSSINQRGSRNNKYAIVEKRKTKDNFVRFIQKRQYLGKLWEKHLDNWNIIK